MAAELRKEYPDAAITVQKSSGGRFEVTVDGDPVFEKSKVGRHARPGEVAQLIASRVQQ